MLGGGIFAILAYFNFISIGKYYLIAFAPILLGYLLIKWIVKKEKKII